MAQIIVEAVLAVASISVLATMVPILFNHIF